MFEEDLSTVTVSSLTGEVKDVGINEDVRFSGEKKPEVADDARENSDVFHNEILSGFSSVIHVGCLGNSHERRPSLGIGLAPIAPFGAGLAGLKSNFHSISEDPKVLRNFVEVTRIQEEMRKPRFEAKLLYLETK